MSNENSPNDNARMTILQMIENGRITAAEGMRLLNAMSGAPIQEPAAQVEAPSAESASASEPPPAPQNPRPEFKHWKNWWQIPFWIGMSITLFGGLLMYWAYTATRLSFWFLCASTPFAFGVLVLALAASTRTAKWVHLRVRTGEKDWPRQIALSFPLPLGPLAWFFRTFGPFIPALKDKGVDEVIVALGDSATPDNPLYVEVDEGEGEEKVQVYIG